MNEGDEIEFDLDGLHHTAIIDHVTHLKFQYSLQIRIIKSEDID